MMTGIVLHATFYLSPAGNMFSVYGDNVYCSYFVF